MTNYSEIVNCLRNADEPMEAKEVAEKTDIRYDTVSRLLKRMRQKGKVFADENLESNYSVMYQLRRP